MQLDAELHCAGYSEGSVVVERALMFGGVDSSLYLDLWYDISLLHSTSCAPGLDQLADPSSSRAPHSVIDDRSILACTPGPAYRTVSSSISYSYQGNKGKRGNISGPEHRSISKLNQAPFSCFLLTGNTGSWSWNKASIDKCHYGILGEC